MNNVFFTLNRLGLALLLMLSLGSARAAAPASEKTPDPSTAMDAAIGQVLTLMRDNEKLYSEQPAAFNQKVADAALPYLAIERMAMLAMATHWRAASDAQKAEVVAEFKDFLLRTYTRTLFAYRNAQPQIIGTQDPGKGRSNLKIMVRDEAGQRVNVMLRLELSKANQWQLIDVVVEGVSMVVTVRGQFDGDIKKLGMDGFIANLKAQNRAANAL